MQVGDLVKFVGHARFYKTRLGVIARIYDGGRSAMVHWPGAEGQARARGHVRGQVHGPLHPMALEELEVVNENR